MDQDISYSKKNTLERLINVEGKIEDLEDQGQLKTHSSSR